MSVRAGENEKAILNEFFHQENVARRKLYQNNSE